MIPAHGTRARYNTPHGCRCEPCRTAGRRYRKLRALAELTDNTTTVDATAARQHLLTAQANGIPVRVIAAAAGLHDSTVQEIRKGARRRTSRRTSDLILAVDVRPPTRSRVHVDPTGTIRRLRALATLGWSTREIAERTGLSHRAVAQARRGVYGVHAHTRDQVAAVYRTLIVTPPPSQTRRQRGGATVARQHAAKHGWAGPLAWDDIDTDEAPTALEPYKPATVPQQARELQDMGLNDEQIGMRLRIKPSTVREYLTRRAAA